VESWQGSGEPRISVVNWGKFWFFFLKTFDNAVRNYPVEFLD
jgi:hypothetical protein